MTAVVETLPPHTPYPRWEVTGTAAEGFITVNVMTSGNIHVKQECKLGNNTLVKALQAISTYVKQEPSSGSSPETTVNEPEDEPFPSTSADTSEGQSTATDPKTEQAQDEGNNRPNIDSTGRKSQAQQDSNGLRKKLQTQVRIKLLKGGKEEDGMVFDANKRIGCKTSTGIDGDVTDRDDATMTTIHMMYVDKWMCPFCKDGVDASTVDGFPDKTSARAHVQRCAAKHAPITTAWCCHLCDGERFPNKAEFVQHYEMHEREIETEVLEKAKNERSWACSLCDKDFSQKGLLVEHMQVSHEGRWLCHFCEAAFLDKQKLTAHLKTHDAGGETSKPNVVIIKQPTKRDVGGTEGAASSRNGVADGVGPEVGVSRRQQRPDGKEVCEICAGLFKNAAALRRHAVARHKTKCQYCGVTLAQHLLLGHVEEKHPRRLFRCKFCSFKLSSKYKRYIHMSVNHGVDPEERDSDDVTPDDDSDADYDSDVIDKRPQRRSVKKRKTMDKNNTVQFSMETAGNNATKAKEYLEAAEELLGEKDKAFARKQLSPRSKWPLVAAAAQNNAVWTPEQENKGRKRAANDLRSGSGVKKISDYEKSLLKVEPVKTVVVAPRQTVVAASKSTVEAAPKVEQALLFPLKKVPTRQRAIAPKPAPSCTIVTTPKDLIAALRSQLTTPSSSVPVVLNEQTAPVTSQSNDTYGAALVCKYCSRKSGSRKILQQHLVEVHGEPGEFSCDLCERQFFRSVRYEDHMMEVHGYPGRFECGVCGKQFRLARRLAIHEATHTKEKYVPCGYQKVGGAKCKRRFHRESDLKYHMKKDHKVENYKAKKSGAAEKSNLGQDQKIAVRPDLAGDSQKLARMVHLMGESDVQVKVEAFSEDDME